MKHVSNCHINVSRNVKYNFQNSPGLNTSSDTVDLKPMVHGEMKPLVHSSPMSNIGKVSFSTEIKLPEGLTHLTSLGHGDNDLKVDR